MFRAILRMVRAIGYLLTGRIDAAREELSKSPHVIRAQYEEIILGKKHRIQEYMNAVSALIMQEEKKRSTLQTLTREVQELERLKTGAAAQARQRVAKLQGADKTPEDIRQDVEVVKCQAAFNDFSSTLEEKQKRILEVENDVKTLSLNLTSHKSQLETLKREIDNLKTEAADAVADIISATEEKQIADMLSNISHDRSSEELQGLRDLRQKVKAGARVSRELAGTDTERQKAEFLEFAKTSVANDEFDKLIGISQTKDEPVTREKKGKEALLPE